ncbi:MAG: toxin-antitoxin system HicB family antitoxin [Deltaproteobacteria bacterium]|nr:toxin-antitoxin system HicB family antitoxin [Deltaproteobacteria bacterium]
MIPSGKFVLRIEPKFHRLLSQEAKRNKTSLNNLCASLLKKGLEKGEPVAEKFAFLKPTVDQLKDHFGKNLLGVLVFGSQVTGEATESSDWDLLIILSNEIALTRSLYRWWDEEATLLGTIIVNPQFVHLPASLEEAGGLWFETACASHVMWEQGRVITDCLDQLREFIASDRVRRYWSQGQPYWVRQNEEQRSGN